MSLQMFFSHIGSQLDELLCLEGPNREVAKVIDRLEKGLQQGAATLADQKESIDNLRLRLADLERRSACLATRVQVFFHVKDKVNAWHDALELDHLRNASENVRNQLRRFQKLYDDQLVQLRRLRKQLLAFLEDGPARQ